MLTSVRLARTIGVSCSVLADIYTARVSVFIWWIRHFLQPQIADNNSYSRFLLYIIENRTLQTGQDLQSRKSRKNN